MTEKVKIAIERLKLAAEMSETYYKKPLLICYSGGKDSDTVLALAERAGVDFDVIMSITTVEAPQTMQHAHETARRVREAGHGFTFLYKRGKDGRPLNMHDVCMKKHMLPTRTRRFCCSELKEISTPNRFCALGVRASESAGRAKNYDIFSVRLPRMRPGMKKPIFSYDHAKAVFADALTVSEEMGEAPEKENAFDCTLIQASKQNKNVTVQPILDWTDADVWAFLRENGIKYNALYDMGFPRVGCQLCPMAGAKMREKEMAAFPGIANYWKRIAAELVETYPNIAKTYGTPEQFFDWWLERDPDKIPGQLSIFDFIEKESEQ